MTANPDNAHGDEITAARLVLSMVVLVAGSLALDVLPLMAAISRLGYGGTALLVLGIAVLSIGFFLAYERLTPSSPPTPRRDLAVILFSAFLIGLWAFMLTNEVVAIVVLGSVATYMLLPETWRQRLAGRLPWT